MFGLLRLINIGFDNMLLIIGITVFIFQLLHIMVFRFHKVSIESPAHLLV